MIFCQIKKTALLTIAIAFFTLFQNKTIAQTQTCPASLNQWQWPTHTNWFSGKAQMINFGADGTGGGSASTKVGPGSPFTAYESCASASDESGNLVIYTNGVKLWDGTGTEVAVPGGLKTGAENTGGATGSAVQGVFITKHPLNDNDYYIFTTDDAIGGAQNGITNGFNYYVYDKLNNTCSGGTRLGGYRTTEQVAGTFHKNGVDIWIVSHESIEGAPTNRFNAYLLECSGLNATPVTSDMGFMVNAVTPAQEYSNERASLEFAPNPNLNTSIKAGATYHCGTGTWDPVNSVSILDFDCLTGQFTGSTGVGDGSVAHSNPYDCEFSGDGATLYVSFQADPWSGPLLGRLGAFNVGSGAYTEVGNTGSGDVTIGSVKLGGDGSVYAAQFRSNGWAYQDDFVTSNGSSINTSGLGAGAASVGYGLPNMFVPPQDWVEIQDPGALTECDLPVDLETEWLCKGTDAENTPNYENAYSLATTGPNVCGACTIDPITGVFDAPGAGTYEVHFTICTIKDTLIFTVGTCGCEADISNTEPICVGEDFLLDTAVIAASGDGVWTIDSVPSTPGVDAIIDDSGADTLFDASALNTKYGIYKLKFTVDNSCEDSMYIEVKKNPTVVVDEFGPLCDDSVAVNMTAIPTLGGDVVGGWAVNSVPQLSSIFDPIALGAGTHEVIYGIDSLGCLGADTIKVIVKERPDPQIDDFGPYCANDPAVTLTMTPLAGDSGVWSGGADALGRFTPSNEGAGDHDVFYTIYGQCGDADTIQIHVDAVKDATIATPDSVVCESEPAIVLTTGDLTGTWFINDTLAGSELGGASFDPATHGPGTYDLIYHLPNPCGDMDTITVVVNPTQDATITSADIDYCAVDTVFNLTATNAGGVWYKSDTIGGNEMLSATLNPTEHTGSFELYYYMDGMCGDIDTVPVTINPLKDATINTPSDSISLCVLDPNPNFTVNAGGGTWNNAAVQQTGIDFQIDLVTLGIVTNEMLIYSQANPCGDHDTIWVTTTNQLDATITQVDPFCDDADSVQLQVVDAGGTFSGTGVDPVTGWFDPVAAGEGTHTITYTINGNCGDVQTIDIVVNRTPDPTITNTVFEFCEDHGDETLTTVETGGVWRELNSTNGGLNTGTGVFNTVTSTSGSFDMEYGFAGACPAYDTITFDVIEVPTITFAPQDTLCEDNAAIAADETVTPITSVLTWSGAGDGAGNFDPAGNVGDNNIILTAENNGCTIIDTLPVHVLPRADATIAFVPDFCISANPFTLGAVSGASDGTWSGNGITDTDNGIFDPATAGPGDHEIRHTITGRCGDWDTVTITVITAPDPTINMPATVCPGSPAFNLTAVTPGGNWGGNVDANGLFNPTAGGSYVATYTITTPCYATASITFDVHDIPNTDFSVGPGGCAPVDIEFTDTSDDIPTQSTWDFGNSSSSNDASGTVSQTYSSIGCYDVTLSNIYSNGCKSSETKTDAVCTFASPDANFTWNPTVLDVENNLAVFENLSSVDVVSHEWDFTDVQLPAASDPVTTANPTRSNDVNPTVIFDSPNGDVINVKLKVTNANGCTDSIIRPLRILDKFSVFVPNAFTPNDDGTNDEFYPVGRNLEFGDNYEFRIYNRWGTLIWMSKTPYQGWDGTVTELAPSGGECAQIDVYVWRLVVVDPFTGEDHELIGRVSLVK